MAVITGMRPADITDIKPFELPIDEMAKGIATVQDRADKVKNAIAMGDSALAIETRPLQEDWDLASQIRNDYKQSWQKLVEDKQGDYSKIDMSEIQALAINYANDDRVRQLTHAKNEYDVFNKIDKDIRKENGEPLLFGELNPLGSSLRKDDGTFRNFSSWDLEMQLDWQKAQEQMFFDPVIGKTILSRAGWNVAGEDDLYKMWNKWSKYHEDNIEQLQNGYAQAAKYYSENSKEGRQHHRWLTQEYSKQYKELSPEEIKKKVDEHLIESFKGLMKKRINIKDEFKQDVEIHAKPQKPTGGLGRGGSGSGDEEDVVVSTPVVTDGISAKGIDFGSFATPTEAADYIERGGAIIENKIEAAKNLASGTFTPPSLNVFNELMTNVSNIDGQNTKAGEKIFVGALQYNDDNYSNPNGGPSPYAGKNNRAAFKISSPNFNESTFKTIVGQGTQEGEYNDRMKDLYNKFTEGKGAYTDYFKDDGSLILSADLDAIGERTYGKTDWLKNKDVIVKSSGWMSSFSTQELGNDLEIINNPIIDKARQYYAEMAEKATDPEDKALFNNKVKQLDEKISSLEQYRKDHAGSIMKMQDNYKGLKEKAGYLRGIEQQALNDSNLNDTEFNNAKNDFKNKNGYSINKEFNNVYKKSLVNTVIGNTGSIDYIFRNNFESIDVTKLSNKEKIIYDEMMNLMSDIAYNKLDHEAIKKYTDATGKIDYLINQIRTSVEQKGIPKSEFDELLRKSTGSFSGTNMQKIASVINKISAIGTWDEKINAYPLLLEMPNKMSKNLKSSLEESKIKDPRIHTYFEKLEDYKKDFMYKGLMYGHDVLSKNTEGLQNLKQKLEGKINNIVEGNRQWYNVKFNRQGTNPVVEEVSEQDITDAITKELKGPKGETTVGSDEIKKYWQNSYQGIRFDREARGGGAYVMQFKLKFPNTQGGKEQLIEVPLENNDFSDDELQSIGIDKLRSEYYKQMHQTFQQSGGYYYDLTAPGTEGKSTRFNIAYSAMQDKNGNKIEKGELYMVGEGDPLEKFDKSRITRVGSPEEAMTIHEGRSYSPETARTKRALVQMMNEIKNPKYATRGEYEKQLIFDNLAQQLGIPKPEGKQWSMDLLQEIYKGLTGQPGNIGNLSKNEYVSPDGNIKVDINSAKTNGIIKLENGRELVKNHKIVSITTPEEALAIAAVYNPAIIQDEKGNKRTFNTVKVNGVNRTYVSIPENGEITNYDNKFQTFFPGFQKYPLVTSQFVREIADGLSLFSLVSAQNKDNNKESSLEKVKKELKSEFGIDFNISPNQISNIIGVVSGRRSLEEQLHIYGKEDLNQLTFSDHMTGNGVDIDTTTPGGNEMMKFLKTEAGQALLWKSGLRAMYHTTDPTGQTGWHIHIESCKSSGEKNLVGTFIEQKAGDLNTITNDFTTGIIKNKNKR